MGGNSGATPLIFNQPGNAHQDDVCQKYLDIYVRPEVRQISDESSRQLEDLVARRRQISNMITAEKNRRRGKTNSVQVDINEHIEWLEKRLKEN